MVLGGSWWFLVVLGDFWCFLVVVGGFLVESAFYQPYLDLMVIEPYNLNLLMIQAKQPQ